MSNFFKLRGSKRKVTQTTVPDFVKTTQPGDSGGSSVVGILASIVLALLGLAYIAGGVWLLVITPRGGEMHAAGWLFGLIALTLGGGMLLRKAWARIATMVLGGIGIGIAIIFSLGVPLVAQLLPYAIAAYIVSVGILYIPPVDKKFKS